MANGYSPLSAADLAVLSNPREAGWQQVKSNASRTVYCGSLGGRVLYVKHYHPRSLLRRAVRRMGGSGARREMGFIQYLAGHGVATAPVVAAVCEGGVEWLATEAVEPSVPADLWHAQRLREGAAGLAAVRQATVALARLVGRMHAAGVLHKDLHCGNILIRTENAAGNGDAENGDRESGDCTRFQQETGTVPSFPDAHNGDSATVGRVQSPFSADGNRVQSPARGREMGTVPGSRGREPGTVPIFLPVPVLMDLHRASRRGRLSRRLRAANLAQLFHDRQDFTTRTDRVRFLRAYLEAAGAEGSLRGWQLLIEDFAYRHSRRQYADRDRRAAGNNRYFTRLNLERGWHGPVVLASKRRMAGSRAAELEFTAADWREALRRPEDLLEAGPGAEVVKDSASARIVRRTLRVGPHEVEVYVKQFRQKSLWKVLANWFRPSRAIRALRGGHALLARHVATALPLAALERRSGPLLKGSILITEACNGTLLAPFLSAWLARPPRTGTPLTVVQQRQLAQEVLTQLGRVVQRLHDSDFAHRDLKSSNVMIRWSPGEMAPATATQRSWGPPPEVVLLDLDGLSHKRRISMARRFQGLMRLNVSLLACPTVNHAGRLRMLLGYLRRPGCGRLDFKPYWRVLEAWSGRKIQEQIRSRRKRQKAARRPSP